MRRVGIDTGGTFTDLTFVGPDGDIETHKTPTTGDLRTGILTGIEQILDGVNTTLAEVDLFAHGSTVAVNALIERTGADTALVTTDGFRDRLEIGELYRPSDLLYDPTAEMVETIAPRRHRFVVDERLDPEGEVLTPLTDADVDAVVEQVDDAPVSSVAVSCLFAYRNADHEQRLAEALRERTSCAVTRASALSAEINEYERTATAVADAYVKPQVKAYLEGLRGDLADGGLSVPPYIMKSDGGLARVGTVANRPITQLISGPIAGVIAAEYFGSRAGVENQITFDMGGTSCDTSLVVDGEPTEDATRHVEGLKIKGPFTTIETIGAGGGSIAWVDDTGSLHVGPRSAGAEPGPACYGRGGTEPTVTDANLLLGLFDPAYFAGGALDLDVAAAEAAMEQVADPLGVSKTEAALAVREVVNSKMAGATRVVSVEQGFDPRSFTLTAFGGAGPMHAVDVHRRMDTRDVLVPNRPGLTSSLGLLLADVRHNAVQSVLETVSRLSAGMLESTFQELESDATERLTDDEIPDDDQQLVRTVDTRYEGQAHYLNLPVPSPLDDDAVAAIDDEFQAEHERVYGFVDENAGVEVVNARVTAVGQIETPDLTVSATDRSGPLTAFGDETTVITANHEEQTVRRFRWDDIRPGDRVRGPALLVQNNSTVWIPADCEGRIDDYKNVRITEVSDR